MSDEKKNNLPSDQEDYLNDKGAKRATDGHSEANTFIQRTFDSDDANAARQEGFDHAKDVMRDEETRQAMKEDEEDDE